MPRPIYGMVVVVEVDRVPYLVLGRDVGEDGWCNVQLLPVHIPPNSHSSLLQVLGNAADGDENHWSLTDGLLIVGCTNVCCTSELLQWL